MAKPLGEILVAGKVITAQQLEEAIQAQVIFGGKLGTNLIELGYVSISTLSRFLSRKYGVPTIDHTHMKPCSKDILKLFGKKNAIKFTAVPLTLEGNRLDVLMADPGNFSAEDEIGFATGKKIKTYVAPEIVVLTLMEKYYGIQRDIRYVQLSVRDTQEMQKAHRKPDGATATSMDDATLIAAAKAPERPKIAGLDPAKGGELSSEADFMRMMDDFQTKADAKGADIPLSQQAPIRRPPPPPMQQLAPPPPQQPLQQARPTTPPVPPQPQAKAAPAPQPPAAPPPMPSTEAAEEIMDGEVLNLEDMVADTGEWAMQESGKGMVGDEEVIEDDLELIEELPEALSLAEAAQKLKEVKDRDELSQVVLAFALSYFKRAALFITRNGMAMGWDGMGGTIQRRAVQGIMLPLNAPSIFKTVHDSMSFFLGAIPKTPINERFLKAIGDEKPRSVFLIPILFKGKVVNILYGDNGHNENAPFDISDLLILAPKIPMAFEELIVKKKKLAAS